jgi:hypothetical protein
MRTPTDQITLNTWTVRVDGQDVADIEIGPANVRGMRDLVADATGQRVSLNLTAHLRGILPQLTATSCDDFPCCGHAAMHRVRVGF